MKTYIRCIQDSGGCIYRRTPVGEGYSWRCNAWVLRRKPQLSAKLASLALSFSFVFFSPVIRALADVSLLLKLAVPHIKQQSPLLRTSFRCMHVRRTIIGENKNYDNQIVYLSHDPEVSKKLYLYIY